MTIQPEELKNFAGKALRIMGVTGFTGLELTYVLKDGDTWKVSFSYMPSMSFARKTGCFKIDTENGEFEGMWLDRTWK